MSEYSVYVPEIDYKERDYKPVGGPREDLCGSCQDYYKDLHSRGLTDSPFPPNCNKHVLEALQGLRVEDFDSLEEYEQAQVAMDPVAWALSEFGWEARWYQEEALSCTSDKKLYRWGRRSGKSDCMAVECLYSVFTQPKFPAIWIAPYMSQVQEAWDKMHNFIGESVSLKNSVSRDTIGSPMRIELFNGSKIIGISSSATSSSSSDKIRGLDARLIVIDEFDTMADKDIDAILALMASKDDCRVVVSSTPRGWRKKFFNFTTNKNHGFKEFWYISAENPEWNDRKESFFKSTYSSEAYAHEFLAEFAETEEGVFKRKHIDKSIQNYSPTQVTYTPGGLYVVGVDWNKSAGTHIVILQHTGSQLMLVRKIIIPESEFIQTESVERIIGLDNNWKFDIIAVDAGYGTTQVEMMKKWGIDHPSTKLHDKIMAIHMNQTVEIRDPVTGYMEKKPAKPFLVQATAKALEDGNLVLPAEEDTNEQSGSIRMGLVQQMRNYIVEGYSIHGQPKYSREDDHTLTAYMLAVGCYTLKHGELNKINLSKKVFFAPSELDQDNTPSSQKVIERQLENHPRFSKQKRLIVGVDDRPQPSRRKNLGGFRRKMF